MSAAPRLVLVATAPRSGSTWLFNAARRILEEPGGALHAAWVADRDPESPAPVHLIKAHRPEEVSFTPDLTLTTTRPVADCVASLIRMGWLAETPEAIRKSAAHQDHMQRYWADRAALTVAYAQITRAPEAALGAISAALGLGVPSGRIAEIARDLAALEAPAQGHYDRATLLHPRHRARPGEDADLRERVREILEG